MYDLNDAEPLRSGEIIPDGTFAKVAMTIRPGGVDGPFDIDKGLLKPSGSAESDVLSLDCEFTVVDGLHARRKFWHSFTVSGGKVDEKGASVGWNISKRMFRGMIDSALGLDPTDMSDAAKAKRQLRGLADLGGITFIAKIMVEASDRYADKNRLERPVLPNEKEWPLVMEGKDVPPSPSPRKKDSKPPQAPAAGQPAWQQSANAPAPAAAAAPATTAAPAWRQSGAPASAPAAAQTTGPAWLNG
ncbi:MAG: hypothetical protein HQL42_10575 [Alphaproteobacteria bacterium]|nr:hypothetical protein [Alphaproteobacteria bacterium]